MNEVSVQLGLGLGFALGLVHAFDADHILAVSTLTSRRPGWRSSLGFCLRWGAGHGFALLAMGVLAFAVGRALPAAVSRIAEPLVGLILIGLGLWVLQDLWSRRVHLHFHEHEGLPPHAHWHSHASASHHRHGHAATLVGALHGVAGSAPILALLPLSQAASWSGALSYLLSFGLGVLGGMLVFGGLLGAGLARLGGRREAWAGRVRAGVAVAAIDVGGYWLAATV